MRLTFGSDVEAFRSDFRSWLSQNAPSPEAMASEPQRGTCHLPTWAKAWTRRMFDAGWLVPGWPPERGGRDAGPVETLVYLEELMKAGVPRTTNPQGLGIVVPSLFDFGDDAQVRDYAMPILRGEKSACLGMSEPGAGSDLAALSTRAEDSGADFVVNGQKVWTSGARDADFCFLFCRTDRDAPKHKGISVLLVDMATPGVTVRPLAEIVHPERADLNEVFFDDVVVPKANLVGDRNNGWAMANGSLAHERSMVWLRFVFELEDAMQRLLQETPAWASDLDPSAAAVLVDRVVDSYVDSLASRALGFRGFAKYVRGGDAPEQALMKMFCSESFRRACLVGSELATHRGTEIAEPGHEYGGGCSWIERYFGSFGATISAGSSEIQRNIIAEKVLGLPKG